MKDPKEILTVLLDQIESMTFDPDHGARSFNNCKMAAKTARIRLNALTDTVRTHEDGWKFNTDTGCLEHPCECLTSWFVYRDELWQVSEWACDMNPNLQRDLVAWIISD